MNTVMVTGAGSGIGAATCRRLARLGHDLVIHTGHRQDAADALARECSASDAASSSAIWGSRGRSPD